MSYFKTAERELSKNGYDFMCACYNTNSIDELKAAQNLTTIDKTDLKTWDIDAHTYKAAIKYALLAKLEKEND